MRPSRQFYSTELSPCPYLPGRLERRLVTFLEPGDALERFDALGAAGFRRSQHLLYRPVCPGCAACIPVRIVVDGFVPGSSFRRVLKRNSDLVVTERPAVTTDEHWDLFRRYLLARHGDGGMAEMGRRDFDDMVQAWREASLLAEMRDATGRLLGVSLTDVSRSGLSGVYKFFEPDEDRRSLGSFIILWHIRRARELSLPYVYLGYWIAGSRKMSYKARFQPMERLEGDAWRLMTPDEIAAASSAH